MFFLKTRFSKNCVVEKKKPSDENFKSYVANSNDPKCCAICSKSDHVPTMTIKGNIIDSG